LQLYFSRPFSRADYVLAKLLVLVGVLSLITWAPALALFGMQTGMGGWSWFSRNWQLGFGVTAGFLMWILLVSLAALASSAYVKWKLGAGALILGFFFVLGGVAKMVNVIFRVNWGTLLNPAEAMHRIWCSMLGVDPPSGPGTPECIVAISVLLLLLLLVLARKLRPVEVIS
jgi:ABC-2 type transport system permease protein